MYRQAWGVTVHLGKLRAKSRKAINGVPERICLAIPLPQIGDAMDVAPLGWVVGNRGDATGVDDDAAFAARLRGRRPLLAMRNRLLLLANTP